MIQTLNREFIEDVLFPPIKPKKKAPATVEDYIVEFGPITDRSKLQPMLEALAKEAREMVHSRGIFQRGKLVSVFREQNNKYLKICHKIRTSVNWHHLFMSEIRIKIPAMYREVQQSRSKF